MNQSFEQSLSIEQIIVAFVALSVISFFIRKWLRKRRLFREGQLPHDPNKIPTIEERVRGNRSWASGEIQSKGLNMVIILWLAAAVWFLTFGVSFVNSLSNQSAPLGQKIALGILSLGGLIFVYFAIRFTARHLRYGKSWCLLDGKAGILGKQISGKIRTEKEIETSSDFQILLQCIETYSSGSGKNRTTHTSVKFQATCSVPSAGISSKAGIPFSMLLPPFPPETGYQLARVSINWQLKIDAPVNGVDYSAMFIVPVFKLE